MKNFLFGFLTAVAAIVCFVFGALFILGEKTSSLTRAWEEKETTELQLTIHPSVDIELSDALGLDAQDMADFLSQGIQEKKESYLSILNSGLDIEIVSRYVSEGPDRTQKIQFRDEKVGNHISETVVDIELIRDEIPDSSIQGSSQLLKAIKELNSKADLQRSSVEVLQEKTKTEQVGSGQPM